MSHRSRDEGRDDGRDDGGGGSPRLPSCAHAVELMAQAGLLPGGDHQLLEELVEEGHFIVKTAWGILFPLNAFLSTAALCPWPRTVKRVRVTPFLFARARFLLFLFVLSPPPPTIGGCWLLLSVCRGLLPCSPFFLKPPPPRDPSRAAIVSFLFKNGIIRSIKFDGPI